MPSILSNLFSRSPSPTGGRRPPRHRPRTPSLGAEHLEPRLALAVTTGTAGFGDFGATSVAPGTSIHTATTFNIANMITAGVPTGYFASLPFQVFGPESFNTANGDSFAFSTPTFGSFQSSSITTVTNVPDSGFRDFYVVGNYTPGTFNPAPLVPNPAPASLRISFTQSPANTGTISVSITMQLPPERPEFLVAADDLGCTSTPRVYVINPYTGDVVSSFTVYEPGFRGGVRVAIGDLDGDPTTQEIVTAPGPGRLGEVRAFRIDSTGALVGQIPGFTTTPFAGYTRGLEIAVGDLDGDGKDDLVAAESRGQGRVSAQKSTGTAFTPWKSFTAFGGSYTGGASVAVAGTNRIVVGSGLGLKPLVKVYDVAATPTVVSQFAPAVPTGTGGVSVTAQRFTSPSAINVMVAGGANAKSAIGVYPTTGGAATKTYNTFASRPKANSPVYAAAAALTGGLVDTVFQSQGIGGVGGILKVNSATGAVDTGFAPQYGGKLLAGPLRIATRAPR